MVYLTKTFINIITIAIVPILAAPMQFGQDDTELIAREPLPVRGLVKTLTNLSKNPLVNNVATTVASTATSTYINQRDLEDAIYARALQDELNARGYDIQLDIREIEGLDARDLETHDNIYAIAARDFVDSMEMKSRQLADLSTDGLE